MSGFYARLALCVGFLPAAVLAATAQTPEDPQWRTPEKMAFDLRLISHEAVAVPARLQPLQATAADLELVLYPNPALEQIRVQLPTAVRAGALRLTLHDRLGRVVRQWNVTAPPASIPLDVRRLARGMYLLRVSGPLVEGLKLSQRVVLE